MILTKKAKKALNLLSIFFFVYIFNLILFGRTLNGLQILGYRVGELLIGFALFLSLFIFFKRKIFIIDKKIFYNFLILIGFFLITFYFSNSSFLNTYTYKASSYIWTISYLYFGTVIFQSKHTEKFIKYLYLTLPLTFIFSMMFFPNPIFNFFVKYSDKFDYLKASDILLAYVLLNFLTKRYNPDSDFSFIYFITSSMLFAPLFSYMSRGAFLAFLLYVVIEIYLKRKYIVKNLLKAAIITIFSYSLFAFSTIVIMTDIDFEFLNFGKKLEVQHESQIIEVERREFLNEKINLVFQDRNFFGVTVSIIYLDGRFYSQEPTVNWRLQLWQDIIEDLNQKNKIFIGYGYSDIIPAMKLPDNNGNDSTNENLHNYFMQVYAKGGLIQLLLVLSNIVLIIIFWKNKKNNYIILHYLLPIITVSMFDPTLESVRFPLLYYSFLGYFLYNENAYKTEDN